MHFEVTFPLLLVGTSRSVFPRRLICQDQVSKTVMQLEALPSGGSCMIHGSFWVHHRGSTQRAALPLWKTLTVMGRQRTHQSNTREPPMNFWASKRCPNMPLLPPRPSALFIHLRTLCPPQPNHFGNYTGCLSTEILVKSLYSAMY